MTSDTTLAHVARMWAKDFGNRPVIMVAGNQPPTTAGEPGSQRMLAAIGFSVYHPSTLVTEVGEGWAKKFKGVREVQVEGHGTAYEIIGSRVEFGDMIFCRALHSKYGRITTRRLHFNRRTTLGTHHLDYYGWERGRAGSAYNREPVLADDGISLMIPPLFPALHEQGIVVELSRPHLERHTDHGDGKSDHAR